MNFSPSFTNFIRIAMCLLCLVSLPLLDLKTSDLLSNIIRGSFYGTISGSLFNNSQINIMKCATAIPVVHTALYSLYVIDWETGPVKCAPYSIDPNL